MKTSDESQHAVPTLDMLKKSERLLQSDERIKAEVKIQSRIHSMGLAEILALGKAHLPRSHDLEDAAPRSCFLIAISAQKHAQPGEIPCYVAAAPEAALWMVCNPTLPSVQEQAPSKAALWG